MTRITIMAGGTGGHVMPALEMTYKLIDRGIDVDWIGTEKGLEATLVPKAGISFHPIRIKSVRGGSLMRKFVLPIMLTTAMWQSLLLYKHRKPQAVLGMGGFVAGP